MSGLNLCVYRGVMVPYLTRTVDFHECFEKLHELNLAERGERDSFGAHV